MTAVDTAAILLGAALTADQQRFLQVLLGPVVQERRGPNDTWPNWNYVRRTLNADRINAQNVFDSLPVLRNPRGDTYGLAWRLTPRSGLQIGNNETVGLSLAGLHHADPSRADRLAQLVALLGAQEAQLPVDPTAVGTQTVSFDGADRYLTLDQSRVGVTSMTARAAADLLKREPIPIIEETGFQWRYQTVIGNGHLESYRDVTNAHEYVTTLVYQTKLRLDPPKTSLADRNGGAARNAGSFDAVKPTARSAPEDIVMNAWPAWSKDPQEVADARVLASLLADIGEDGQTSQSPAQIVEQLGIDGIDPDHLTMRLVQLGYFRDDSLTVEPGSDTLLVTAQGRAMLRTFAAARQKIKTAPAARSAILLWLYEFDDDRRPDLKDFLDAPESWYYGTQVTQKQAADAARNLHDRGLIRALDTGQGELLRLKLTSLGVRCVERYDSDPDALENVGPTLRMDEAMARTQQNPTVFLVHGHDEALKYEVTRYIEQTLDQSVSVVILHEQANGGRTLIEKFEGHARTASYAVVLLTPDDRGGPAGGEQNDRARQNVVFELGYFCGCLGRNRVAAINKGVEIPSDIHGVAYIPYEAQWKDDLRMELRHAGLPLRS